MNRLSHLARAAVAATALFAATASFAGTFTPELSIAYGSGKDLDVDTVNGSHKSYLLGAAVGYTFDNGLGGRILTLADGDPWRGLGSQDRSFDKFWGVQAIGVLPLASHLNLTGGAGIGSTSLNRGANGGTQTVTDGILSIGLQVPMGHHYAMELRVDHLTTSGVTATGLRFQIPF